MNRYALNSLLDFMHGLKSIEASDGQDGINKVKEYYENKKCACVGIKVIFMDIEMPIIDGIKATKILRQMMIKGIIPVIPIIALTAYLDERAKCLSAGMTEFRKFIIKS